MTQSQDQSELEKYHMDTRHKGGHDERKNVLHDGVTTPALGAENYHAPKSVSFARSAAGNSTPPLASVRSAGASSAFR